MEDEVEYNIKKRPEMYALNEMLSPNKQYIDVDSDAAIVTFTVKNDKTHTNGCNATDMLEYIRHYFNELNKIMPCHENNQTILKLDEALHWQYDRKTQQEIKNKTESAL